MGKRNKQEKEREGKKMNENVKTVDTVRERERERELHFINRKCGFVQQPDTHTISLEKKIIKYISSKLSL